MESKYRYSSEIKSELINLLDEYCYMKIKEDTKRKEDRNKKIVKIKELTYKVYDHLSYDVMLTLVKKKLPLRVKLFNKISVIGYGIEADSSIFANCIFNDSYNYRFDIKFSASEINERLKLNYKE